MPLRLLSIMCVAFIPAPLLAATYAWDFRNGHFDNLALVPLGPGAVNLLKPTKDGLKIVIPAGADIKLVGFSPRFKIHGDFEITVDFTIVSRSPPQSGFGSGPSVYLSLGTPQDPAASLGRLLRPDGQDHYGVFAARVDHGTRIPTARLFDVPLDKPSKSGQMRLTRVQGDVTYFVAEDLYSDPRQLASLPLGAGDVTLLRIGLSQSDAGSSAEMILHDLRIRADELPHLPSEQSRTAQLYRPRYQPALPPKSYRWLWQLVTASIVAGGFAAWIVNRQRRH
jgi:hypothetical protein